jgi:cell division protein FtsB
VRLITLVLIALVVLIQYPLWLGRGGWLRVHELERQVQLQTKANADARARNEKLDAEVRDLKEGAGAVEERARYELGMIKDGEVFVQIVDPPTNAASSAEPGKLIDPAAAPASSAGAAAAPHTPVKPPSAVTHKATTAPSKPASD